MKRLNLEKWQRLAKEGEQNLARLLHDGGTVVDGISARIERRLQEHKARNRVSLAFVGQYSAGKSTIISALTGRNDIVISPGIATDKCTAYDWEDLRLVDTPGLYTERVEHDQITNDEIERSDLLAYCITVELFDPVTLRNFRELAGEKRYAPKMVVVVNKLFSEARRSARADATTRGGSVDERIENYQHNLQEMVGGGLLRSMPLVFVDAQMYRDGVARENAKFIEKSRFSDLIASMNTLSEERGLLGKADTPFRIVLGGVNDAIVALSDGEDSDRAFLHILNRFLELVMTSRREIRREFREAANKAARAVLDECNALIATIDGIDAARFAAAEQRGHERLQKRLEEIQAAALGMVLTIGARLRDQVAEIESMPLFESFVASMSAAMASVDSVHTPLKSSPRAHRQIGILQNLALGFDGFLSKPRKGHVHVPRHGRADGLSQGGSSVAPPDLPDGSTYIDDAIRHTVDNLNDKFHWHLTPDGAINATHHVNQFLHAIGPALAIGSAALSLWAMHEEEKATEMLGSVRVELQENFAAAREEVRTGFEALGEAIDRDVLRPLEAEVRAKREMAEAGIGADNRLVHDLQKLRTSLETNLGELASTVV